MLVAKIDSEGGSECFEITFSGYRCMGVRRLASPHAAAAGAVIIAGPLSTWQEMIESIQQNGKANLAHTLNTLTLADWPMQVSAANQLDVDRFYRYQQTLQEFFDEAGRFETDFATPRENAAVDTGL